jgi:GT2 family glycosyltransferase
MKKSLKSKIYIGIVTYNSKSVLSACLRSIEKQTHRNIIVSILDNNSQDTVVPWLNKHYPSIPLITESVNLGFGRAHNRLICTTNLRENDYYMPLNPDVVLDRDYIKNLLKTMASFSADWGTGKLFKKIGNKKTKIIYSLGHALLRDGYTFNIGYGVVDKGQYNDSKEVFGAPGAASLISGKMIRQLSYPTGLFDSDMFLYNEDTDVDWRAQLNRFRCVYAAKSIAYHVGSNPKGLVAMHALANRYLSVIKNAFLVDLIFFNIPIILSHVFLRILFSPYEGIWLLARIVRFTPMMLMKRTRGTVSRKSMLHWFFKNKQEQTTQPTSWYKRIYVYFSKKK